MKWAVVGLAALLPACVSTTAEPRIAIVWNRVEDPQPVCESLSGRKSFFHILGCSHWSEPVAQGAPRVCTIYSPEPRSERDTQRFATLGHELMHCFDGNWHDRWGRMNSPAQSAAAGATK
jgi:hypothetical protein